MGRGERVGHEAHMGVGSAWGRCVCHGQEQTQALGGDHSFARPDGGSLCGEFRNGKLWGAGKWTLPGVGSYEGEWVNGCFEGRGRFEFASKEVFVGMFQRGCPLGGSLTGGTMGKTMSVVFDGCTGEVCIFDVNADTRA